MKINTIYERFYKLRFSATLTLKSALLYAVGAGSVLLQYAVSCSDTAVHCAAQRNYEQDIP